MAQPVSVLLLEVNLEVQKSSKQTSEKTLFAGKMKLGAVERPACKLVDVYRRCARDRRDIGGRWRGLARRFQFGQLRLDSVRSRFTRRRPGRLPKKRRNPHEY
jgi:hypothetical protein